jgi:hypothetical protein
MIYIELELRQLSTSFDALLVQGDNPHFKMLRKQLEQYFNGARKNFDIPLDLVGTEFQKQVWLSLLQIPYSYTTTYAKQAELLGKPSAVRAVANTNGKIEFPLFYLATGLSARMVRLQVMAEEFGGRRNCWRLKRRIFFNVLINNVLMCQWICISTLSIGTY